MKLIDILLKDYNLTDNEEIAVITEENSCYSYNDIRKITLSLINKLTVNGIHAGERVLVISDHDLDAIIFLAAASALNIQILMPYNLHETSTDEWINLIISARPDHVFFLKKNKSTLAILRNVFKKIVNLRLNKLAHSSDTFNLKKIYKKPIKNFLILFTSGTTGKPKAISISEKLICFRIEKTSSKLKFNKNSKIFMSGLINNTTGIIFSFGAFLHKSTLFIPKDRDFIRWPKLVDKFKITHIMLRPVAIKEFIDGTIQDKINFSSLLIVAYGAASVSIQLLEKARELIPCEWIQGYGLSETFGPFCWLTEQDHKNGKYKKYIYCVGKPDYSLKFSVKYIDGNLSETKTGELVLSGNTMMNGYISNFQEGVTRTEEWFHTGDLVEITEDGYIVLKGRLNNSILTKNGHRIYPEEIESFVKELNGVNEAILINIIKNLEAITVICISGIISLKDDKEIVKSVVGRFVDRVSKEKWPEYIYACKKPFMKNQNDKIIKNEVINLVQNSKLININL